MTSRSLAELTHVVANTILRHGGADLTDAQLLAYFVEQGNEAAFEALVRRHAPMVHGVCRRLLQHAQDAEDAVQVVFLVLARKAASVRPRAALAGWLYGVACKAALKARSRAVRRKERQVVQLPEPPCAPDRPPDDLRALIDRELHALPDKYRAVLVLCDLEGQTRRDAARQLGWTEGTVCGRLARARSLLAKRLIRRGLTLSVGALHALVAADSLSAAVPAPLLAALIHSASPQAVAGVSVSPRVWTLAHLVQQALFLGKLRMAGAALLVVGCLGAATGLAHLARQQPSRADPPQAAAAVPAAAPASPRTPTRSPRGGQTDAERLQGTWTLVWSITDGKPAPQDSAPALTMRLTDKNFHSEWADRLFRQSTYKLDPTHDPRWIDLIAPSEFPGHVSQGIYRFEGDELMLCLPRANADRPIRFESKPGSGVTLGRWRRADS
jgi:RNA polymerase sigma-70 factor (ECF subfamily)